MALNVAANSLLSDVFLPSTPQTLFPSIMKEEDDWPMLEHLPLGPVTVAPRAGPLKKKEVPYWRFPWQSGGRVQFSSEARMVNNSLE